ncbi:hypothetical protein HID58_028465 [Brassica napus]|uniref:Uncharacterized protein n=1 Tax=Brassica napus TaxID=3708 RepID=A0ABQ8CAB0_BRANA|nr:hypothetical protein HID58_028465 [Brassica napus]
MSAFVSAQPSPLSQHKPHGGGRSLLPPFTVKRGMKVVGESDMTDELLMRQLLKFDGMRQKEMLDYIERHMALGGSVDAINNKSKSYFLKKVRKEEKKLGNNLAETNQHSNTCCSNFTKTLTQ